MSTSVHVSRIRNKGILCDHCLSDSCNQDTTSVDDKLPSPKYHVLCVAMTAAGSNYVQVSLQHTAGAEEGEEALATSAAGFVPRFCCYHQRSSQSQGPAAVCEWLLVPGVLSAF